MPPKKPTPDEISKELCRTAEELFDDWRRLKEQAERLCRQSETIKRAIAARDESRKP
jgi:hypothetical protein